jgi:hypothetical protein
MFTPWQLEPVALSNERPPYPINSMFPDPPASIKLDTFMPYASVAVALPPRPRMVIFPLLVVVTGALMVAPLEFWARKLPTSPSNKIFPAADNAAEMVNAPP